MQLANREETGGITVLGYAAATNMDDAVRLLLQVGADPSACGSNGKNAMDMTNQHSSNKAEMLCLLQAVKEVQAVSSKDASTTDADACLRATGTSAAELVAPVWDVLLGGAVVTPHPEVCFAIFSSLFNTVTAVHPAILEHMFVAAISTAASVSGKSPKSVVSPRADDTPGASAELAAAGLKVVASARAERFFKLLASIAKRFCRNKGVHHFAQTSLPAVLKLLKLPTSWPLARLCHKLRLIDPTLSELAGTQEAARSAAAAASPFRVGGGVAAAARESEENDDENEEEEAGDDDENEEEEAGDEDENEEEEAGDEDEDDVRVRSNCCLVQAESLGNVTLVFAG